MAKKPAVKKAKDLKSANSGASLTEAEEFYEQFLNCKLANNQLQSETHIRAILPGVKEHFVLDLTSNDIPDHVRDHLIDLVKEAGL